MMKKRAPARTAVAPASRKTSSPETKVGRAIARALGDLPEAVEPKERIKKALKRLHPMD